MADVIQADAALSVEHYIPHGYCLLWEPEAVWIHAISGLAVALACFSIALSIIHLLCKRRRNMPFRWILALFALFIFLSGITQLLEVITLWYPAYYLHGIAKALTAAVALATALLMFPLIPAILERFERLSRMQEEYHRDHPAASLG